MSGEAITSNARAPLMWTISLTPKIKGRPKSLSFCLDNTVRRIAADIHAAATTPARRLNV